MKLGIYYRLVSKFIVGLAICGCASTTSSDRRVDSVSEQRVQVQTATFPGALNPGTSTRAVLPVTFTAVPGQSSATPPSLASPVPSLTPKVLTQPTFIDPASVATPASQIPASTVAVSPTANMVTPLPPVVDWSSEDIENLFILELPESVNAPHFVMEADGDLRMMKEDGSGVTRLTLTAGRTPSWAPDGKRIAFSSLQAVPAVDGVIITQVTIGGGEDPAWSPDGSQIAFGSASNGQQDIYIVNPDGANLRRLTTAGGRDPTWSPDSTQIAFVGLNNELYTIRVDGTGLEHLSLKLDSDCPPMDVNAPAWSPDGDRIAFDSHPSCARGSGSSVYLLNLADLSVGTPTGLDDATPTWSAEGKELAVHSTYGIRIITLDGTRMHAASGRAMSDRWFSDYAPDWFP